jgi:hypothetical protein
MKIKNQNRLNGLPNPGAVLRAAQMSESTGMLMFEGPIRELRRHRTAKASNLVG